jgi:hypothetical protein
MSAARKIILALPGVAVAVFVSLASIGPADARSNLAEWASFVGISSWPPWLTDKRAMTAAVVLAAAFYAWLWGRKRWAGIVPRLLPIWRLLREPVQFRWPIVFGQNDRIHALESEVREKDRQLEQHIEVMKYGSRLLHASPLTPADQRVLAKEMEEIRPFVDRGSEKIRDLMSHLLHHMQSVNPERPRRDARYWLAIEIREGVLNRIKTMQERFDAKVESEEDAREALTGFIVAYETGEQWVRAMGTFLDKPINDSDEWRRWKPCNDQLVKIVRDKYVLPQFAAIEQHLNSIPRLEAIMLEGLPSGLSRATLPPPDSAS